MLTKIQITGEIEVVTGLHIGGSGAFAAIGAVDSPVIRDVRNNKPMIPGSSLKGKMRTLLAKEYNKYKFVEPADDDERIVRLFGGSTKNSIKESNKENDDKRNVLFSRIAVRDMFLKNEDELRKAGLQSLTEVKFENNISRATAVANPRQIERVVRGSVFGVDIVYEAECQEQIVEDFETLTEGFKLLSYDYLGGSGSRGYGQVKFNNLKAECVIGKIDSDILEECNNKLDKVSSK